MIKRIRSKRQNDAGSVLLITALALPVLLGAAALALDAGLLFDYRQRMSAAADAASVAGAMEVKDNYSISQTSLETYARDSATRNGFLHGLDSITVTVTRGTFDGTSFTADTTGKYVKVEISRPTPTYLMQIMGWTSMTVGASAISGPDSGGTGCIYALNKADPMYTTELSVTSSTATIDTPNCAVISNGNFSATGTITASEIDVTASTGTAGAGVTPAPTYSVSPADDPFSDMNQSSLFGTSWTCGVADATQPVGYTNLNLSGNNSYILHPGVYCGDGSTDAIKIGLNNDPAYTVHFEPGVYIINGGGLDWKHSYVNGTGVTFYLTGTTSSHDYPGCGGKVFDSDPPLNLTLTAPTSGAYEGLLFIQDRTKGTSCLSNPVIANFQPSTMMIDGVVYYPNHHITYSATTVDAGSYTIVVGGTLTFSGTATLKSDFTSLSSGSPVKRTGIAQ